MIKILLMGVSGSGKTRIGKTLASHLNIRWYDGDDFHSKKNISQMKAGIPLTNEQRVPWLDKLATLLNQDNGMVIACSALREQYRKQLLQHAQDCTIFWLDAPKEPLQRRLEQRSNHFFPPSLLISQLESLEPPSTAVRIDSTRSPEEIVTTILNHLTQIHTNDAYSKETPLQPISECRIEQ